MKISMLKKNDLTNELIDRILFENLDDQGEIGDCIMVLGSKKSLLYRIPKAVEMVNEKRSTKLLLCGGNRILTDYGLTSEAELMKRQAIKLGIPKEDIIIEEQSLTTKENMICAMLVLERAFKLCCIHNILLVTTHYHMRRSIMMAQTYLPNWIKFFPCPANDINTKRENWYKTEKGYQLAFDEAWKIICYVNEKSIPDFEI